MVVICGDFYGGKYDYFCRRLVILRVDIDIMFGKCEIVVVGCFIGGDIGFGCIGVIGVDRMIVVIVFKLLVNIFDWMII